MSQRASPAPVWSVPLGETPAAAPRVVGEWLLLPTHEAATAPVWSRLRWLGLPDGRPGPMLDFEGVLISGLAIVPSHASEVWKASEASILVATYSAEALGEKGALLALDAAGEERWRWAPKVAGVSAPALAEGRAWVTTNTGLLIALDLANGAEQARFPLAATPSPAAPALAGDVAYVPCRGPRLLALGLDGQARWEFRAAEHPQAWLNHTPLIRGEYLCTVLNHAGWVIALQLTDGELAWQVPVGPAGKDLSPPVSDGQRVYVGSRAGLHALDPADGRQVWHFPVERGLVAPAVLVGGAIYVAGRNRHLYVLEAAGGRELWHYPVERRIEVPPLIMAGLPPLAVVADQGGTITALQRPLSAAEHQAAGDWAAAATAYTALGELAQAAELLETRAQPLKAAPLWQTAGHLERAGEQYELAGAWPEAADVWGQLGRPLQQAQALENYARSLASQSAGDQACADAWEEAAQAFEAAGQDGQAGACRREVARCRGLPYLAVEVKPDKLLVLNTWTKLRFIVHNRGGGAARQLIIRAQGGQFEGQVADTRQITTLQEDKTREDWLDIRPLAHGDSVPLRVSIEYQDRLGTTLTWQQTLYLPVAPSPGIEEQPVRGISPDEQVASLRRQLANLKRNLLTIEERTATFIDPRGVPPDLAESERLTREKIAELEARLAELET